MNKYQELCLSYEKDVQRGYKYRDDCLDFYSELYKALMDSFQIPHDKIYLISNEGDETTHHVLKAMYFDEDYFYHMKIMIEVEINKRTYPKEKLVFEILVKKKQIDSTSFIVKFPEDIEFTIDYNIGNTDFSSFLDHLFSTAKGFYDKRWKQISIGDHPPPVGFKFESINKD